MNTALPTTAKTENAQSTQSVQQIQCTQYQHQTQDTKPCKLDKVAKADKADKGIIPTLPASAPQPQPLPELRILRIKEVAKKLSIGKSTIYDWINKKSPRYDETFPKPIKLSSKSIGWLSTEIDAWLLAKAEQTRGSDFG